MNDQGKRGRDGGDHARRGHLIAVARGGGVVHQVQPQHETGGGRDIDQLDDRGECAHAVRPLRVDPLPALAGATPADSATPTAADAATPPGAGAAIPAGAGVVTSAGAAVPTAAGGPPGWP